MTEAFKEIEGTQGQYQISNFGNVKTFKYNKSEGILKKTNINRYEQTTLRIGNKNCHVAIHRLVALAFLPNPENKKEVNHKDGNKLNNNVNNLEWVTRSENEKHSYLIGIKNRRQENHTNCKTTAREVLEIRQLNKNKIFKLKELAELYSQSKSNISNIIYGVNWKHI